MSRQGVSRLAFTLLMLAVATMVLFQVAPGDYKDEIPESGDELAQSTEPESPTFANDAARDAGTGKQTLGPSRIPHNSRLPDPELPEADPDSELVTYYGKTQSSVGDAVGNIRVELGTSDTCGQRPWMSVTSDEAGLFQLQLPADRYWFYVEKSDHWHQSCTTASDPQAEVVLVLQPRGGLFRALGTVSHLDGKPLAGVRVARGHPDPTSTQTDESGRYDLAFRVPPDEEPHYLSFFYAFTDETTGEAVRSHKGVLISRDDYVDGVVTRDVTMGDKERRELKVPVTIRVTDSDDQGVAARLNIDATDGYIGIGAETGEDGVFQSELAARKTYMIHVSPGSTNSDFRPGLKPRTLQEVYVNEDGLALTIELEALQTGTIEGQINTAAGAPLADFAMDIMQVETFDVVGQIRSDSAGWFVAENLPEGLVEFSSPGTPYHLVYGVVVIPAEVSRVTLLVDSGLSEITGRVIDASNGPVGGQRIRLDWSFPDDLALVRNSRGRIVLPESPPPPGFGANYSMRDTVTDAEGWFAFYGLADVPHRLRLLKGYLGDVIHQQVVDPSEEPILIQLAEIE
ncbi:MAG: hypothetical protein QNJ40_23485 [Xanthomonadales bacterium]|nr:hypothetical protein [Xanthomonadales bacterium]